MYHKTTYFLPIFLFFLFAALSAHAQEAQEETIDKLLCTSGDRLCLLEEIVLDAAKIEKKSWRDQTYREAAKTYAFDGEFEKAIAVLDKIETPDTKALTIRGIGMAIAPQENSLEEQKKRFSTLRTEADKITHPPSYAIALTYIAMAQAFAGDNEGAWKTASDMENDALRHKAYGETAEIQAEKKDYKSAQMSIEKIESLSFRNKAYTIVSKILSDHELFEDAYEAAIAITNPYKKAQALQYILDVQKPRDVKH